MHFARLLRAAGLRIGPDRVVDCVKALEMAGASEFPLRREDWYWTMSAVLLSRNEQRPIFDQAFRIFWRDPKLAERMRSLGIKTVGDLAHAPVPLLKAEFVVIVAHFDALGAAGSSSRCVATGADAICNGANDNASGTAAVLELAQAFAWAPSRPLRSVLFLAVSGEESGLWGSKYFVNNPPIPLASVVAALNVDMIGRNSPDSVFVAGLNLSTLGDRARAIALAHLEQHLRLAPIGLYANSDHWPFVQTGVPALMFYNGSNAEYHLYRDPSLRHLHLYDRLAWDHPAGSRRPGFPCP